MLLLGKKYRVHMYRHHSINTNLYFFQVWRDYKANTKKKLVLNKQQIEGTGGGPNKLIPLSDMEEAVSALLNFNMSVAGIPNVSSFGVENIVPSPIDVTMSPPKDNEHYQPQPKYFRKDVKEKNASSLLQQQIEMQRKFYEDYRSLKREELGYLEAIAEQLKSIGNKD